MNLNKKIFLNFKKPRSIYDYMNKVYKQKYNPSKVKENKRMERRYKSINRYDDEETEEPPIEQLTAAKAKIMVKMINENYANHRLSRKPMPEEEKKEYIKKSKEYSLWATNVYRKKWDEKLKIWNNGYNIMNSTAYLPVNLMLEVWDVNNYFKEEKVYNEAKDNNEFIEYSTSFLYLPQYLKIAPDDIHIAIKTMINLSSYSDQKSSGTIEGLEGANTPGSGEQDSQERERERA